MDPALTTRIQNAVDAGFDAQVDFTSELIRFPSIRGQEQTAQDFMAAAMRARGLPVDRWQVRVEDIAHLPGFSPVHVSYENAFNVVGAHRPHTVKGRSLILNVSSPSCAPMATPLHPTTRAPMSSSSTPAASSTPPNRKALRLSARR